MIELNFNLSTSIERNKYVKEVINKKIISGESLSIKDLELLANYILYGKDNDGESCVDRKEIEIKTRYNSYNKKEPESLEALLEDPVFNEALFIKSNRNYKVVKPTINREKDKNIPNMEELWKTIDYLQHILDVNKGKVEDETVKKLSELELYRLKHILIDIRRQQFYLKDIFKPSLKLLGRESFDFNEHLAINWDEEGSGYLIKPLGVCKEGDLKFYEPRQYVGKDRVEKEGKQELDFRNALHVYELIENYEALYQSGIDNTESLVKDILRTLDFYIEWAKLSPEKMDIINGKKLKISNEKIRKVLKRKYGITYSTNYISTIYKQKICREIASAAKLHWDYYLARENDFLWKKCNRCQAMKLKDTREFVRKTRSSDGLSNRCKICDKEEREKKKEKERNEE